MTTEATLEQVLLRLRALEQEGEALRIENAALARQIEQFAARRPEAPPPAPDDKDVSRRHLLTRLAGVAAAGVVGQAVLAPEMAGATTGVMYFGTVMNSGTDETFLDSTTDLPTLTLTNFGTGSALDAGLAGNSTATAIVANTAGRGNALYAGHTGTIGDAVRAEIDSGLSFIPSSNASSAIKGVNAGAGPGVTGEVRRAQNAAPAVVATTNGLGPALQALVTNGANQNPVIVANSNGSGGVLAAEITNAASGGHVITAVSAGAGNGVVGITQGVGHGVAGSTSGTGAGVTGTSRLGPGILGSSLLAGPAVRGGNKGTGRGIEALISNATNSSSALFASTTGTGRAIEAQITNTANNDSALLGQTAGKGPAIKAQGNGAQLLLVPGAAAGAPTTGPHLKGEIYNDLNGVLWLCVIAGTPGSWVRNITGGANALGAASLSLTSSGEPLKATSTGTAAAVVGIAASGRGGQFQGSVAQLRLIPAAGAHPATGQVGDLFLDSAKFLWLCKGSTWVRLG